MMKSLMVMFFFRLLPSVKYHFNRYTSDKYGNLMNQYSLGMAFELNYRFNQKLNFILVSGLGLNFKEESIYQDDVDSSDEGFYFIEAYASYAFNKNVALRLGYSQGDAQVRGGVRETYFFDRYNSLYSIATDITF